MLRCLSTGRIRSFVRAAAGVLAISAVLLGAFTSRARASGQRGAVLSEKIVETFTTLSAAELGKRSLNYVGSTSRWHVFMRVDTAVGGGMPFDHLSTYKVDARTVTLTNGWQIRFSDRTIQARDCPRAIRGKGAATWSVPAGAAVRRRCGT